MKRFLLVGLILSFLICKGTFAAEIFKPINSPTRLHFQNIVIEGTIEQGDFNNFYDTVKKLFDTESAIGVVVLNSPGGDVIEAMKIGRLIRKLHIKTFAPLFYNPKFVCFYNNPKSINGQDRCVCSSSCFLIWAGGVSRNGNYIKVHRPYFSKEYFKGLSGENAKKKYLALSNDVRKYLKEMNIPTGVIEEMFQYSSKEIKTLDREVAESMEWVPFYHEWIIANCGDTVTDKENMAYIQLGDKKRNGQKLSRNEQIYRSYIDNKTEKHQICEGEKRYEIQYKELK